MNAEENTQYITTIGLEVHAELKTKTKMFCNSKNDPDEENPNVNICPVCMGHPGTLPTINKEAVKHVLKVGAAVGGAFADFTEFDRKNYFYPDIPKGYQISQYKFPLISGGELNGVKLTRIHLEEDTATSDHTSGDYSLVNFNRAGVPLMELVTEPVIHSAKEAGDFARELQLLLRTLGVGDANMEKGEMRVEANISVMKKSPSTELGTSLETKLGTKVEVKNLNSFRAAERAIEYEVKRHIGLLEKGEKIVQETRGWDENKQSTFSQRQKEDSHDYRYFPDPDLPKIVLSEIPEFKKEVLEKELPELPWSKRERYEKEFKIKKEDAEILIQNPELAIFFEETVKIAPHFQLASNYILSDILGLQKANNVSGFGEITVESFAKLLMMLSGAKLSSRAGKDILGILFKEGGDPEAIAEKEGLIQKNDEGELKTVLSKIIEENPNVVSDYKGGKESALMFFVGQGMKATKGSANPQLLKSLIIELIK